MTTIIIHAFFLLAAWTSSNPISLAIVIADIVLMAITFLLIVTYPQAITFVRFNPIIRIIFIITMVAGITFNCHYTTAIIYAVFASFLEGVRAYAAK